MAARCCSSSMIVVRRISRCCCASAVSMSPPACRWGGRPNSTNCSISAPGSSRASSTARSPSAARASIASSLDVANFNDDGYGIIPQTLQTGRQVISPRSTDVWMVNAERLPEVPDWNDRLKENNVPPFQAGWFLHSTKGGSWKEDLWRPQPGVPGGVAKFPAYRLAWAMEAEPHWDGVVPEARSKMVVWGSRGGLRCRLGRSALGQRCSRRRCSRVAQQPGREQRHPALPQALHRREFANHSLCPDVRPHRHPALLVSRYGDADLVGPSQELGVS